MNTLYVSDLDGTLLQDDATLSPFSRQVLNDLLGEGLPFTVASARSIASIRTILAGLTFHLPVIEFNGAFLSDLASGQHLIINDVAPAVAQDVHQLVISAGSMPFLSTFDGTRDRLYYGDVLNEGMRWYVADCRARGDPRLCHIADLAHAFRERIVCLTTIGREPQLAEIERAVLECHADTVETHLFENRYSPGWHWLTVHDQRATKDQAIQVVIQAWDLEDAELVVFGDNINDLKMFRLADRAIAVGNAIEPVKAAATEVIGPNGEDSVVRYMRDDWNAKMDVIKLEHLPLDDLEPLLAESRKQGFAFLDRLVDEYVDGSNRFDLGGEALFGVYCDQRLIAIGGLNHDLYLQQDDVGRVRHVYVLASQRGKGVGKRLLQRIIEEARPYYRLLTLRTVHEQADQFYRAIGFQTEPKIDGATHHLRHF